MYTRLWIICDAIVKNRKLLYSTDYNFITIKVFIIIKLRNNSDSVAMNTIYSVGLLIVARQHDSFPAKRA